MKNILKLALAAAALLMVTGASSVSAQKFGYIDSGELIQSMPEITEIQANLEKLQNDLGEQYDAMVVEYNKKLEDFRKNNAAWTDSVRQLKEQELQEQMQRLQRFEESAGQDMQDQQRKLMQPVIEKAREAVQSVAKAQGLTAVFDLSMGAMIYYDEATMTNMLPLVKKHLGIN